MEQKISFGFKKALKKPAVIGVKPPEKENIELIECIDEQSIKVIGKVEEEEKLMVIPMIGGNKNLLDRLKDVNDLKARSRIKYDKSTNEVEDTRPDCELNIEELAARKLVQDAQNYEKIKTGKKVDIIPIEDQLILEGAKEPTLDDYETVPISDYGYAMLRGMGWSESQANKSKVEAPSLRPKGMGLGASFSSTQITKPPLDKNGKPLKLVKGARAKLIAGKENGSYCTVQGFDEDTSRVIVKTSINGSILSVNEGVLLLVTNEEYAKSSKVINNDKYNQYKDNEVKGERKCQESIKEEKNDVEYVPTKNVKIEISSESECDKNGYGLKTSDKHRDNKNPIRDKDKRSNNNKSSDKDNDRHESHNSRAREKSKDSRYASSSSSLRERSPHRKASKSRKSDRTLSGSKISKSDKSSRYSSDDISSSDSETYKRHKKSKKKSKKHKKDRKHKRKSRKSESSSSDSDDR